MSTELQAAESQALAEHESVIERGLNTFVEVGTALLAIREQRLYREGFSTFEDYCQERWGFDRTRAQNFITAARTVLEISNTGLPAPTNEAQARELARVPEVRRADVWAETVERTHGRPTAAAVRETYDPPEPKPPPITAEEIAELRSVETPPAPRPEPSPAAAQHDEAELFASLDDAMEGTDTRFRLNFGRAMKMLFPVLSFDRARIVETSDHAALQGELDLLTEWADDLRRRMKPGLRVVGGERQ